MLTIWGRKNSSNVMPVLWTADELGLAYDHINTGGRIVQAVGVEALAVSGLARPGLLFLVKVLHDRQQGSRQGLRNNGLEVLTNRAAALNPHGTARPVGCPVV